MSLAGAFVVRVDGQDLPDTVAGLLVSAVVEDSLRLPDTFVLTFRDPQRAVVTAASVRIGSTVDIGIPVGASGAPQALLKGEVTALEASFDELGTYTTIRGYDAAHRLFRGRRTATYLQMTSSDIARKVAQRASLTVGDVTSTSVVHQHRTQGGSTDWDFLEGLAREVGFEVAVRDGKFVFGPSTAAQTAPSGEDETDPLVLTLGHDLLRFRAVLTAAEQVPEVQVRGWDTATKKALVGQAPAGTTSAVLSQVKPADLASAFAAPAYVATAVPYGSQAEVDGAAKALAEQIAGAYAEFEGTARGNPALRAGAAISVAGLEAPFDGKYTLTTSRHRYDEGTGYTTSFTVSGRQERSLYGLTGGGATATAQPGVVVAQVSDVGDPEHAGRVKVQFPWLSDDVVSDWARTVQPGAGKDRGAVVLPEVGDEVLVAFEQGDLRRPYVLGGLYNGVDTPDSVAGPLVDSGSGAIDRRSFVSRRGHRVDLLDHEGGKDGVTVSTKGGSLALMLDATGTTVTVHADGTVVVEGSKGVKVDAGTAKLELLGGEVSLKASTGGVTIDGGPAAVKVSGGTLSLAASATAELKGGATCSISGALVKIN